MIFLISIDLLDFLCIHKGNVKGNQANQENQGFRGYFFKDRKKNHQGMTISKKSKILHRLEVLGHPFPSFRSAGNEVSGR